MIRGQEIKKPNPYGYRLNVNDPEVRTEYDAFRRRKGIPYNFPLSHEERFEFEREYLSKRKIP